MLQYVASTKCGLIPNTNLLRQPLEGHILKKRITGRWSVYRKTYYEITL